MEREQNKNIELSGGEERWEKVPWNGDNRGWAKVSIPQNIDFGAENIKKKIVTLKICRGRGDNLNNWGGVYSSPFPQGGEGSQSQGGNPSLSPLYPYNWTCTRKYYQQSRKGGR